MNTGSVLRTEKDVFLSYVALGNENINEFFERCHGEKSDRGIQDVHFATKSMKVEELEKFVNPRCFNLLNGKEEIVKIEK